MSNETETFWEDRYRASDRIWSGRPNAVLTEVVGDLPPGTALDLGCGEGGDAVWLAGLGWHVTAVDVSPTALSRVVAAAAERGLADRVAVEQHDLTLTFPEGSFDLVSAQFLQSPLDLPAGPLLRRAAARVAVGGRLVVVHHAAMPPWAGERHEHVAFPGAQETYDALELDPVAWTTERVGDAERFATLPDGRSGTLVDGVVVVRREA